jgi:EAL domain-containing protein (putative c-di-GMP-specific phosphodiesterase class I)
LDLNSGLIIKAEALIRQNRPDFGIIGPDEFIPIAEQSGLIIPIGKWVFATACQFLQKSHQQDSDIRLSINLPPRQVSDRLLLSFIHSTVRKNKVAPKK